MGFGISQALLRAGLSLAVRDIDPARNALAREAGAQVLANPREIAAAAPVTISVVVNAAQTDAVCFAEDGLVHGAKPGHVLVLCYTVAPDYTRSLAARLAPHGITLIDAPISGGPARAAAGTMSMMIAGDAAARAHCVTLFDAMSDKQFVVSDTPGDGSTMKIVNNLMAGINLVGAAEAYAFGVRAGLSLETIHKVSSASSGQSWMAQDRMARVRDADRTVTAQAHILTKDVGLALDAARALNLPLPMGSGAHNALLATLALGHAAEDDAAVIRYYQTLTGIKLP
jgi:L-threonate 2-dehydrogenase